MRSVLSLIRLNSLSRQLRPRMRLISLLGLVVVAAAIGASSGRARIKQTPAPPRAQSASWDFSRGMLLEGVVVTMNEARDVLRRGHVLVRDGRIVAVWDGPIPPAGIDLDSAARPELGPNALIYPGLINLHGHPLNDALPLWQAPSSHAQAAAGRPTGTEPYANRYQWSVDSPPEFLRLVPSARTVLTDPLGLDLAAEVVKYGEARMILGGATATQGAPVNATYDTMLARNVDNQNFGRDRI